MKREDFLAALADIIQDLQGLDFGQSHEDLFGYVTRILRSRSLLAWEDSDAAQAGHNELVRAVVSMYHLPSDTHPVVTALKVRRLEEKAWNYYHDQFTYHEVVQHG